MKNLNKIYYLILLSFVTACGPNNECNGTFYMSNAEKAFMTYECDDSISITFNCNTDTTLNWESIYEARYCLYDIVKEHDALEFGICIHEYERWIIQIYPKDDNLEYESNEVITDFELEIHKFNNEFNVGFEFYIGEPYVKSVFGSYPFIIDNEINFFSDTIFINGKSYENVFTMVDNRKEFYDTLYYSPNYGCIKLITETGTYTFENLN